MTFRERFLERLGAGFFVLVLVAFAAFILAFLAEVTYLLVQSWSNIHTIVISSIVGGVVLCWIIGAAIGPENRQKIFETTEERNARLAAKRV